MTELEDDPWRLFRAFYFAVIVISVDHFNTKIPSLWVDNDPPLLE